MVTFLKFLVHLVIVAMKKLKYVAQSYHDAIHTLRGQIAAQGLSFELIAAIMCLALAELMLPDSVPALKIHLQAIGTLFQSYGPEALRSGIPHTLFLGFRPFIIAEAVRDRQPTFLATETWMNIPFSVTAPSHAQEVFTRAAALPSILQQVDILMKASGLENALALRALIRSLLGVSNHLSAWEKSLGLTTTPTISSTPNPNPSNFDVPQIASGLIDFPNISVANGLTHSWSFRIVCLLEIENILFRLPRSFKIYGELAEDLNCDAIQAEADRLAYWICSSMSYLVQDEMKLFGPVSTLFPAQIAYVWFKRDQARYQSGINSIKAVVAILIQKGLLSASLLVFGENLH
ncbi:hypothetical protein N7523_005909 [Penicillium sp. IBT 18751x]|nr:hypothetical protein N7523_005909 [Penicillium sp. IBT 18751x]